MTTAKASPRRQLDGLLARYDPAIARQAKAALKRMRALCPGALELVYDNYNALAIGFATGPRVRDIRFSIALYPRWVSLFFFRSLPLPDPAKRLKGVGRTTRHIVLADGAATLDEAPVAALIAAALKKAEPPFAGGRGKTVIKSVSPRQRPRRPAARR